MSPLPDELDLKPLKLRDVDLILVLDDDGASPNYKQHVTGVTLTPATSTTTTKTLSPRGSFTSVGNPTWTAALAYIQDWDTPDSLSHYLFAHQGAEAVAFFAPRSGGPVFRAAIPALVSGPVGGAGVDSDAAGTVTLGITGVPTILASAGLDAAIADAFAPAP